MTKKTVKELVSCFSSYEILGTVGDAIKFLQERFQPSDRLVEDSYYEYSVYRDRLETDEEYARRMKAEAEAKEKTLARKKKRQENKVLKERKEYERLKKKFEE